MKIVISTYNGYAWIVPIFLYFFRKYWPDNPYQIEILTETDHLDGAVFYAGKISWPNRIINYIKQSEDDKFMIIGEDTIIRKTINTERVKVAEELCKGDVGCVRLNPPDRYFKNHVINSDIKGFKEYPQDKPYSISFHAAVWQKQLLLDILRDDSDIWKLETRCSERLYKLKPKWKVLWSEIPVFDYHAGGLMHKARFRPDVVKWALLDLIK